MGITKKLCGIDDIHKLSISEFFFSLSLYMLLCYTHIRPVLAKFIDSPATLILLITYGSLFLSLLCRKFGVTVNILKNIALFIVFIGGYLILTIIFHPEYDKVIFGPYHIFDNILFPMSAIWTFFFFIQDYSPTVILKVLFWVAVTCWTVAILESLEVIANGYWLLKESTLSGSVYWVRHTYNIGWAYKLMASTVVFAVCFFRSRRKILFIPIAISLVELFLFGSRGAVLMFCVCWALCVLFADKNKVISRKGFIIIIILLVSLACILLASPLLNYLASYLKSLGITSRTLNMLLSGDIASDSGRNLIYDKAWELIKDIHIFGYGIYGDRYHILTIGQIATNGYGYCHNVFLELLITFGIWGLILIIIGCKELVSVFLSKKNYDLKCVFLICFCSSLNLILSNSFWYQYYFWALVALMMKHAEEYLKIRKKV